MARSTSPLRLVTPNYETREDRCKPRWNAPPPEARPGDRCEPWPLVDPRVGARFSRAARARGIASRLAALVTVECLLTVESLDETQTGTLIYALDEAAAASRVRVPLSEPSRAYLRALDGRSNLPQAGPLQHILLPMRLSDRVQDRDVDSLLISSALDRAILWERAALLAGHTVGEWAAFSALGAVHH